MPKRLPDTTHLLATKPVVCRCGHDLAGCVRRPNCAETHRGVTKRRPPVGYADAHLLRVIRVLPGGQPARRAHRYHLVAVVPHVPHWRVA